jgi:hypothetical protein
VRHDDAADCGHSRHERRSQRTELTGDQLLFQLDGGEKKEDGE